jgi:predicted nucleic acid-binding protein
LAELVCNTSPIQYLHQLGQLHLLHALATAVFVPPAVATEIARGITLGVNLPDLALLSWIDIRAPQGPVSHGWQSKLGLGESEVLQLGLEMPGSLVVIDDRIARRAATDLKLPLKGTIGLLIDAKRAGLLAEVRPMLDQLDALGFRLATSSRAAALRLAGEAAP